MPVQGRKTYSLVVLSGPEKGRSYPLDAPEFLIGGSDAADLREQDPGVNWRHAVIRRQGKTLTLQALTSFGVEVNHQHVTTEVQLHSGDTIEISPKLAARIEGSASARHLSPFLKIVLSGLLALAMLLIFALAGSSNDDASRPLTGTESLGIAAQLCGMSERGSFAEKLPPEFAQLIHHAVESGRLGFRAEEENAWHQLSVLLDRLGNSDETASRLTMIKPASLSELRGLLRKSGTAATMNFDEYMGAVLSITRIRLQSQRKSP